MADRLPIQDPRIGAASPFRGDPPAPTAREQRVAGAVGRLAVERVVPPVDRIAPPERTAPPDRTEPPDPQTERTR